MADPITIAKAAKVAVELLQNPEEGKKALKGIIIGAFTFFVFISISILSLLSLFSDQVINEEMNVTNTSIYKKIYPVYEEYKEDIAQEMIKMADEILEEDEEATVYITTNGTLLAKIFAYITVINDDVKAGNEYVVNRNEIKKYLRDINIIKTTESTDSEGNKIYDIKNLTLEIEEIATKYFEEKAEITMFLASYESYLSIYEELEEATTTEYVHKVEMEISPNGMEIPLYLQYSAPWGSMSYGSSTIKKSGCAPTAIAMVVSYLQETTYPQDIVAFTGNRYYVPGAGSAWSIFPATAEAFGISCSNLGKNISSMIAALEEGKPVIASMSPGTFTSGGHFIVLRGITEEGKILVNDPNDSPSKNHAGREFDLNLIERESKNFWSFGK